jgi:hypothetical protein
MATVKELKEKYSDRINPSKKDIDEKGITPLTKVQLAAIEQGIDPETGMHWTAGDTLRNGVTQNEELEAKSEGKKEAQKVEEQQEENAESTSRAERKTKRK